MRSLPILATLALLLGGARLAHADCTNAPTCSGGPVRIMFVIDGSSELLNAGSGPAPMGTSAWDLVRDVLAVDDGPPGDDSIYSAVVDDPRNVVLSQIAHVGLVAFGSAGQEVRVVDYGPCTRENLAWALDPRSSCEAPGCDDPWDGPPITWTFVDGSEIDPPGFVRETWSTMPQCQGAGTCSGSDRAVHTGIALATTNQADYEASTGYTHDDDTIYVNILLVAESYAGASTDTQVQDALEAAVAAGTNTYVIAFGAGAEAPSAAFELELENMAAWGSNGTSAPRFATSGPELHEAIREIVAELQLPCCHTIDCSAAGGADDGGIGNEGGDDAADGGEWGSLDGEGDASAEGADASASDSATDSATASDSDSASGEAGFDDDGGCRCEADRGSARAGWLALLLVLVSAGPRRGRGRGSRRSSRRG